MIERPKNCFECCRPLSENEVIYCVDCGNEIDNEKENNVTLCKFCNKYHDEDMECYNFED